MFIHTRSSASNMFAKFGWKTRTFCHKKVAKVIAKLESDRLYSHYIIVIIETVSGENARYAKKPEY